MYFSYEMETLLNEYRKECKYETAAYDKRKLTDDDYIFRWRGEVLPMTPSTFTWRFNLFLRKHGLPEDLNVHSLRHTNASLLPCPALGHAGHLQPRLAGRVGDLRCILPAWIMEYETTVCAAKQTVCEKSTQAVLFVV